MVLASSNAPNACPVPHTHRRLHGRLHGCGVRPSAWFIPVLAVLMLGLVCLGEASGAIVHFVQSSANDADNSTISVASNQWLETAIAYTTVTAPATTSSYRFTHWTNSASPATVYRDDWGRSLNPISFTLYEDTITTAHYLPSTRDSDADGVPDWYEIEYYGTLANGAASDTDGDGITLLQEYNGGTHPLYANASQTGGVSTASSALVTCNLAGYASYTVNNTQNGTVDQSGYAAPGTVITTGNMTAANFGYWLLDGVRQLDLWGIALRQISFVVQAVNRIATAYFFTGDTDADAVPDAWEQYYYGSLSNNATSDTDGDGRAMLTEYTATTSPVFGNSVQEGGVAYADSALVTVNLAGFNRYTFRSVPAGTVNQTAIVPDGTTVTTSSLSQSNFGYWAVDGVRQQDAWGVALRQVSVTVNGTDREAVAYFYSGDSDADGVADAVEIYHFGSLTRNGTDDSDGDGVALLVEVATGTSPVFGNSRQEGGVSWADSVKVVVDQQIFPADRLLGSGSFFSNPYTNEVGSFALAGGSSVPTLGDWDGDGDLDLIVGGTTGAVRFFHNGGSPFAADMVEVVLTSLPNWPSGRVYPALGDWTGDGRADLVVGSDDGVLRFYRSVTGGANPFEWVGNLTVGAGAVYPAFWQKTGGPDLLVLEQNTGAVLHFAKTTGSVPYAMPATNADLLGTPITEGTAISVADTNEDGRVDILASDSLGHIWRFLGQANGSFSLESKVWGGTSDGFRAGLATAVVDFDGDGDPDILGGGTDGALIFLRNPARHLRVTPTVATVGTGESIDFTSIDNDRTIAWSMGPTQSGSTVNATTGHYIAGSTPGIDQVVARNAAGRTGVAWVNVVQRGGIEGNKWQALLVDGRRSQNDPVSPASQTLTTRARDVLKYRGLSDSQILWLGYGANSDARPTRAALQTALRDGGAVSADTTVLMVYLADHGRVAPNGDGLFLLSENESVTGPELDSWLDSLQAARPSLSVVVVLESCYGGRVASPMSASDAYSERRLVLTSSGTNELAHLAANGLVSYSMMWWSGVSAGKTIAQAHADAVAAMALLQTPQSSSGGTELAAGKVALDTVAGSGRPVVTAVGGDISLNHTQETRLTVGVESAFSIEKVWGVIVPPNYQASGDAPVIDLPEVQLKKDAATGQWTSLVGGFSEGGAPYTVLLQARDVWGQVSEPALLHVTQAEVRNRVIIFGAGNSTWDEARDAGKLATFAWQASLLRRIQAADIKVYADSALHVNTPYIATAASLQNAIGTWANADGQLGTLTVFLVGRGTSNGILCANGETITPAALKGWLDALQAASGAMVQVIVYADYSGKFVKYAGNASYRRIVVSSTDSERTHFNKGQWTKTIRWIWEDIAKGHDLRESYDEANKKAREISEEMTAKMDDDGDGGFSKEKDGKKSMNAFVGSAYVTADDPPFIGKASAAMQVASGAAARFWVSNVVMPAGEAPDAVWGEVVGPDGTNRGSVTLWNNVAKDRYEGSFHAFTEAGRYLIFIQAGTQGDPAKTTPTAIVQVYYSSTPSMGSPATENLPVTELPTDGQSMAVETEAGAEWSIALLRGQRVLIEAREVAAGRDVALSLLGSGAQVLSSADQWGAGFGESISGWEAPADGTYIVRATFAAGTGVATCSVRASIKYDAGVFNPVVLTQQAITFAQMGNQTLTNGAFTLNATASSGLGVRFELVSGNATLLGNTVTPNAVGDLLIRAMQDGNATWESAEPVARTISVVAAEETYETWAQSVFGGNYASQGGASQDADSDGQTNQAERQAHTDPTSAADVLRIKAFTALPEGLSILWNAKNGVAYRIMVSTDLVGWTELSNTRVTGNGGDVEIVDTDITRAKVFYRLEVISP